MISSFVKMVENDVDVYIHLKTERMLNMVVK